MGVRSAGVVSKVVPRLGVGSGGECVTLDFGAYALSSVATAWARVRTSSPR